MVNNQSRNLSFPHRRSASRVAMNEAKLECFRSSVAYEERASEKEETKGVYSERYGKCESSIGESGESSSLVEDEVAVSMREDKDE